LFFNESAVFLAQVDFALTGTAKVSRIFGGCWTHPSHSCSGLEQHRRPDIVTLSRDIGIPKNTRAALPKISIRSKSRQIHLLRWDLFSDPIGAEYHHQEL